MKSNSDPVSLWIDQLREADCDAAGNLWRHFVDRLQAIARQKLQPATRRVYDEEDAAQSAFHSVCNGISAGRFPDLHDREGLWQLLLVITSRKVCNRVRYDQQLRRDVRRNLNDSVFLDSDGSALGLEVDRAFSKEPTPEFAVEFVEVCENLFQSIDDPLLKQVALLRIEGFTDAEIGEKLDCSRRTVQRRLEIIRRHCESFETGQC